VIMVGYSLGGHAATTVASDCQGLILISPIDSVKAEANLGLPLPLGALGQAALGSSFNTKVGPKDR
jgi:alpha-beta hydrolase superfamily lysophospholipase